MKEHSLSEKNSLPDAEELLERHHDLKTVREFLSVSVADEESREVLLNEVRKIYYAKRRKRGTIVLLIGCVLLLVGFCSTVLLFNSNTSFTTIMYSFTGIGILAILAGVADIMGF